MSGPTAHAAPTLARSLANLAPNYDVIVVGSGYGGAVAALRFAQAGLRVCVLERGREFQPGDFPRTEAEGLGEFEFETPYGHLGRRGSLARMYVGGAMSVLTASGVGGGSLINAGVFLRPDPQVFEDERWPAAFRADVATRLAEGYAKAEQLLAPEPYPSGRATPPKLAAMEKAAQSVGLTAQRAPLTIAFADRTSSAGIAQAACTGCGECCGGCNVGAKTTLTATYLAAAARLGAAIFAEADAQRVERRDGQWLVHFDALGRERELYASPGLWIAAPRVVIAAGTLGSTALLARSRAAGLACSERIGAKFSGNGDMLSFAFDTASVVQARGSDGSSEAGPSISGSIPVVNATGQTAFLLQEGTHPTIATRTMRALLTALEAREKGVAATARGTWARGLTERHDRTLHWLSMGADTASGTITVDGQRIRIAWPDGGSQAHVDRVHERLRPMSEALGGTFTTLAESATVHPLGGCPMAERAEDGVVDHRGRVFAKSRGADVYDGLYVLDGSIIPCALGANPLATICAVAERACALAVAELETPLHAPVKRALVETRGRRPLTFSERMAGPLSGAVAGAPLGALDLLMTIEVADIDAMAQDPGVAAGLFGVAHAPGLAERPLMLTDGVFHLLARTPDGTRRMIYQGTLRAVDGRQWFLNAQKQVRRVQGGFLEGWEQTTHLEVKLHEGSDDGDVVAVGVLKLHLGDFVRRVLSARAARGKSTESAISAGAAYFSSFVARMVDTYTPLIDPRHIYDRTAPRQSVRELRVPRPTEHGLHTADGRDLLLTRYRGHGAPVLLLHGFSNSAQLFALDTQSTNLVEHLHAEGRDVWVLDWRSSCRLEDGGAPFTLDEVAQFDHPAAVAAIRGRTGARQVDIVAHCVGAQTVLMSVLGGHLPREQLGQLVILQVAAHFATGKLVHAKVRSGLPTLLDRLGLDAIDGAVDSADGIGHRLLDVALKAYPIAREERCDNATCRREAFLFGDLTKHANLSSATHARYAEFFGRAAVRPFRQMATITRAGGLRDFAGRNVYLPHLDRLALPVTFIHGAENRAVGQEATAETYRALCAANGSDLYRRYVVDGYGHIDCVIGDRAWRDVFPLISIGLARADASAGEDSHGKVA